MILRVQWQLRGIMDHCMRVICEHALYTYNAYGQSSPRSLERIIYPLPQLLNSRQIAELRRVKIDLTYGKNAGTWKTFIHFAEIPSWYTRPRSMFHAPEFREWKTSKTSVLSSVCPTYVYEIWNKISFAKKLSLSDCRNIATDYQQYNISYYWRARCIRHEHIMK